VLAFGIGGIMAAISLFANDVRSPWPWLCLAAGALALWLFSRVERSAIEPILPAALLRLPNVALATSVDGLMGAAYMGAFVVAPIVLFEEFGFTVSAVALIMLLRTVSLSVTSPLGGRIAERFGLRAGSGVGAVSMWIAIVLLALGALDASLALFATGLILQGLGQGVARPSLVTAITAAVPEEHLGVVTAATRLARQGGAAVGITVMTQVYGNVGTPERFATSFGVGALFALGALVLVLRLRAP
jgi:MFS family permease